MFHTVYFVISSCLVFTCTLYIVICVQTLFDCITFLFLFSNCMIVSQSYVTLVSKFGIGILTTLYYLLSPSFFFFFLNYQTKPVHALSAFLITLVTCEFHMYCQSIFGQCESKMEVHVNNSVQYSD